MTRQGSLFSRPRSCMAGIVLYGFLVVAGSRLSRAMFAPESVRSLWGFPFKSR